MELKHVHNVLEQPASNYNFHLCETKIKLEEPYARGKKKLFPCRN